MRIGLLLAFVLALPILWQSVRNYLYPQPESSALANDPKKAPTLAPTSSPTLDGSAAEENSAEDPSSQKYLLLMKRFHAGDYESALKLAEELLADSNTDQALRARIDKELPVIIISVGWLRIGQERCPEAIALFETALAKANNPEAFKGLSVCFYRQKDWAQAKFHLERFFELGERGEESLRLYAAVLENLQWYPEALEALNELQEIAPKEEYANKAKSLDAIVKSQPPTVVANSGIFRIEYAPELHDELVPLYIEILQEALDEFLGIGFKLPANPIEVVLYSYEDFHKVFHYGPEWAQGLFDGRMRIPVGRADMDGARRILRHELVHALFADHAPRTGLPSWFSEGLAQRLECGTAAPCQTFSWPPNPGQFLSTRDLEEPYVKLSALKAKRAYQQSLFLILAYEYLSAGDTPLRTLITNGGDRRYNTGSGQLLEGSRLQFTALQSKTAELWQTQTSFWAQ